MVSHSGVLLWGVLAGVISTTWAVTWSVTVPFDKDASAICEDASACSLQGALRAAAWGDTVEVQTDTRIPDQIVFPPPGSRSGRIFVEGRGHVVQPSTEYSGRNARAITMSSWHTYQVANISGLTFSNFKMSPNKKQIGQSVICASSNDACGDDRPTASSASRQRGAEVAGRRHSGSAAAGDPDSLSLILHDCTFFNNTAPAAMVQNLNFGPDGGGMIIEECTFISNTVWGSGTYGSIILAEGPTLVRSTLVEGNRAARNIFRAPTWNGYPLTLSQVKVGGNTITSPPKRSNISPAGFVVAGAASEILIEYTTFTGNKDADFGIVAYHLTMVGTLLRSEKGGRLITTDTLSMAECTVQAEGGGDVTIESVRGDIYNRNPSSLNITLNNKPAVGCSQANQGPAPCSAGLPCNDVEDPFTGVRVGYKCPPPQLS